MSNVHVSLYNGKVDTEDLSAPAASPDRSKPPPLTEAEQQGQAYLDDGRRRADRQRRGYRIDPIPEPAPDGTEPEFRLVCRSARNLLRFARGKPTAAALWHAYDCREEMRRQTREASLQAALFLDRVKLDRRKTEAEAAGKKLCDCGREIDPKYRKCFECHSNGR